MVHECNKTYQSVMAHQVLPIYIPARLPCFSITINKWLSMEFTRLAIVLGLTSLHAV